MELAPVSPVVEGFFVVIKVTQDEFQDNGDVRWSKIDYSLQSRPSCIDVTNNAWEEILDQFAKDKETLETNLVVGVVMLQIGFASVVEWPFPDDVAGPIQCHLRAVYSVLTALSLASSFFSLLGF